MTGQVGSTALLRRDNLFFVGPSGDNRGGHPLNEIPSPKLVGMHGAIIEVDPNHRLGVIRPQGA